jgi:hypothetical protein
MTPTVGRKRKEKAPKVDRRTSWREAAALLGGDLIEGKRPSQDKVLVIHEPWRIWVDTYVVSTGQVTVQYTRVRAFFRGWRGLTATVRSANLFDRLWRKLAGNERPGVSRALLEKHVVKGRPAARVPSLLLAAGLTEAILEAPPGSLGVKRASRRLRKRHGEGLAEVVCLTTGIVDAVDKLVAMVRVVEAALEALAGIGESVREEAPDP